MGKWQFPFLFPLFLPWPLLVSEEEFFSQWFIGGEEEKRVCSVRKKNGRRPSLSRPAFWRLVLFTFFCKFFPMLWIHTICDQKLCDWLGNTFHFFSAAARNICRSIIWPLKLGWAEKGGLPSPYIRRAARAIWDEDDRGGGGGGGGGPQKKPSRSLAPLPNSVFPSFLRRRKLGCIVRPHNKPPPPLPHLKRYKSVRFDTI